MRHWCRPLFSSVDLRSLNSGHSWGATGGSVPTYRSSFVQSRFTIDILRSLPPLSLRIKIRCMLAQLLWTPSQDIILKSLPLASFPSWFSYIGASPPARINSRTMRLGEQTSGGPPSTQYPASDPTPGIQIG